MNTEKHGYFTLAYRNDYGQEVTLRQEYNADATWMEYINQMNAFLHACQFVPAFDRFIDAVDSDVS